MRQFRKNRLVAKHLQMDLIKPLDLDSFAFGERAYVVIACLSVCLSEIPNSLRVRTWLLYLDTARV